MINWYIENWNLLYGDWPFLWVFFEYVGAIGVFGLGWWIGRKRALRK